MATEREDKYKDVPLVVLPGHEDEWLQMQDKDSESAASAVEGEKSAFGQYDYVGEFSEGLAAVQNDGKWGYIDRSGTEVIPCIYDAATHFENGVAKVVQNGFPKQIDKYANDVSDTLSFNAPDVRSSASSTTYVSTEPVHARWSGNVITDILGPNPGLTLAKLPDMLFGMFTGRRQDFGLKENAIPLALILSSLFCKRNPVLKIMLLGLGGAALFRNAGEAVAATRQQPAVAQPVQYKQYEPTPQLDPRISNVRLSGNVISLNIDGVPHFTKLNDRVMDAYRQGAFDLNTLAQRILEIQDRQTMAMQQGLDSLSAESSRNLSIK